MSNISESGFVKFYWQRYCTIIVTTIFGGVTVKQMPDLPAFFTNMSAPMPLYLKLYLVFRNNFIKLWKRQGCCGHPGEPGC